MEWSLQEESIEYGVSMPSPQLTQQAAYFCTSHLTNLHQQYGAVIHKCGSSQKPPLTGPIQPCWLGWDISLKETNCTCWRCTSLVWLDSFLLLLYIIERCNNCNSLIGPVCRDALLSLHNLSYFYSLYTLASASFSSFKKRSTKPERYNIIAMKYIHTAMAKTGYPIKMPNVF